MTSVATGQINALRWSLKTHKSERYILLIPSNGNVNITMQTETKHNTPDELWHHSVEAVEIGKSDGHYAALFYNIN